MKRKIVIWAIIAIALILTVIVTIKSNVEIEYIPEQEISESNLRNTLVTLYFQDINSGEVQKESVLIDAKSLLIDPYQKLVSLLLENPQSTNLQKIIPDGVKINSIELNGSIVNIDLSKEFTDNVDENRVKLAIESITLTLKELNEVQGVNVTVDGEKI